MTKIIEYLFPNVMDKIPELLLCTGQTLYMMLISGIISFCIGIVFGVLLVVTRKGDILENLVFWTILDKVINFFRSVPFIILLALLIPVTRAIVGTAIGTKGAMVPLIVGTAPFFTRQMQAALAEIDRGTIEAALAMGISPVSIIFRVYFKESIPSIIRGVTITFISLVGLTAMAGAIGGGGLGDFAIRYGYQRYQTDVTIVTVVILVLIVTAIQTLGDYVIKKISH
ncbi:MAG: ABC transporter permease [Elusimicrobiota bacterium]|jgi:D-methionine transport system permease protein|nr:ABC transporter permease [Elusimicrobiota bacterium]